MILQLMSILTFSILPFCEFGNNSSYYFEHCYENIGNPLRTNSFVYTPNNTAVATTHTTTEGLTSEEISNSISEMAIYFPNATLLANPTSKYNCHSYAWYLQNSDYNFDWMSNPGNYVSDYTYYRVYAGIQIGDIICYINSNGHKDHSGRITGIYSGTSNGICGDANLYQVTSKWGAAGLYSHRGDECPYTYPYASGIHLCSTVQFFRLNSSHTHYWQYISHNNYYHFCYCSCSCNLYEAHTWVSNSKSQEGVPGYICSKCGKTAIYPY